MSIDLLKTFKACGFTTIDDQLANDLTKIVDWQQKLKEVNVENVHSMLTTIGDAVEYIYNEDKPIKNNDKILDNAPEQDDNFFLVPKVIKN